MTEFDFEDNILIRVSCDEEGSPLEVSGCCNAYLTRAHSERARTHRLARCRTNTDHPSVTRAPVRDDSRL